MAKLPKKRTMLETVKRVAGYTNKMLDNGKLTMAEFTMIRKALIKLESKIDRT